MSEKGLYGIPFPHWDVIARIMPGFVFLTVLWAAVSDAGIANNIWGTLNSQWYYWIGVFLFSYIVGHAIDPATVGITKLATGYYQGKENCKRDRQLDWNLVYDYYTMHGRDIPEGTSIDKSQVESRSLTNMGCLVLFTVPLAIVTNCCYGVDSLWEKSLGGYYSHVIVLLFFTGIFLLYGGFRRQGRRVYGVNAIYPLGSGFGTGATPASPSTPAAKTMCPDAGATVLPTAAGINNATATASATATATATATAIAAPDGSPPTASGTPSSGAASAK